MILKRLYLLIILLIANPVFSAELESVKIQLKWQHGFQFAGYYAAIEKGFYKEAGLDVSLIEYYPMKNNYYTKVVVKGEAQYGTGGANIILSYLEGKPVVVLSQIFQHSPLILLSLKKSGIETPYNLPGKTISYNTGSVGGVPVRFMLRKTLGKKLDKIKNIPSFYAPENLTAGEVDSIVAYITDEPFTLKEMGYEYNIIKPQNYGIDFYGDNFFTSREELKNHPERVKKMNSATLKGWEYALDNPEEIIDIILKKYNSQNKSKDHLRYEAEMTAKMILKDFIPLGSVEKIRVRNMLQVYKDLGYVDSTETPQNLFYATQPDIVLNQKEAVWLADNCEIDIALPANIPPLTMSDNGRTLKGTIPEILKIVAGKAGMRFTFIPQQDYPNIEKSEKMQVFGMIHDIPANRQKMALTAPYESFSMLVFTSADKLSEISSPKDLKGKKVGVLKNNLLAIKFLKKIGDVEIVYYNTPKEQLEMLQYEKIDAIVGYNSYHYMISNLFLSDIVVAFNAKDDSKIRIGVANGPPELISILNKAISKIPANEVTTIRNKWLTTNENSKKTNGNSPKLRFSAGEQRMLTRMDKITMCIDPNWLPFEKNENGTHIGMTADYVAMLQEIIGVPIEMLPTKTWSESVELGKARKCDIFSLVMPTPERRTYLNFTAPYLSIPLVIATNIDEIFIDKIDTVTDKRIGVPRGYAYAEILREKYPAMNLVNVENVQDGLEKVKSGELFGFVGTLAAIGYNIQEKFIGELKIAGKFDEKWELGIGTRNDMPHLLSIFDKAIAYIPQEKQQEVLNRWISVKYERGVDYSIIWKMSAVMILITTLILYRHRSVSRINSQLIRAQKELRQKSEELQEQQCMVDKHVIISTTDKDGVITSVNEAFCKISGYSEDELIGQKHSMLKSSKMSEVVFKNLWKTIADGKNWQGEIQNKTKTGKEYCVQVNISPILNSEGEITGYRSIQDDITDKKRIEELSITDALTGLYNRMKLDEALNIKLNEFERYSTPFIVILMDIDDFKKVNDTYGHDVGDDVIIQIADILTHNIRITDMVGRWGGEEFVIICSNTSIEGAARLAEKIRSIIENHDMGLPGRKTVSMGITECRPEDTIASIFKRADKNLYTAKKSGKNQFIAG